MRSERECWEWQAVRRHDGYGQVRHNNRMRLAHRVSYELTYGEIKEGMEVMHNCDNPACVNPKHLALGTHQENMADRVRKGRHIENASRGENHPSAVLTSAQVMEARALYDAGKLTSKEVSIRFGLGTSATHNMLKRKTWKHIP